MRNLYKYIVILLVSTFLFSTSCRKPIEKRIIGKWKRIIVEDMGSTYLEYWKFDENGRMFVHKDEESGNGWIRAVNDSGTYMINSRLRRDFIYTYIDSVNLKEYDGVWEIIYLKKNTMMVVKRPDYESFYNQGHRERNSDRQGSLTFREFERMD